MWFALNKAPLLGPGIWEGEGGNHVTSPQLSAKSIMSFPGGNVMVLSFVTGERDVLETLEERRGHEDAGAGIPLCIPTARPDPS